jgi:hypothetical protein
MTVQRIRRSALFASERSMSLGAWTLICSSCWEAMLDGKARREEWEVVEK